MAAANDSHDSLARSVRREWLEQILPFWREKTVDAQHGGFIAEMSNDLRRNEAASKGLILNARILWTLSAAYGSTKLDADAALARRAYRYLGDHFLDRRSGGYYWSLDPQGLLLDETKKIYGQAFCVYALVEYHRTFDDSSRRCSRRL